MELESKAHDEELKQFEAAMKIQAAFRGYLDRQDVNKLIKSKHSIEREKTDEDMVKKLNDPNVRNAAYKIQAGFKSLKEMRGNKQKKVDDGGEDSQWQEDASSPRPPSPFPPPAIYLPKNQRRKSFQKTDVSLKIAEQFDPKHEEVEQVKIDVVLDDPEVENAASTIQAALKGSMFRKKILGVKGEEPGAMPIGSENNSEVNKMEKGSIDIDLNDPEVENAAKKIQAGFKMSKSKKNTANEENVKEK